MNFMMVVTIDTFIQCIFWFYFFSTTLTSRRSKKFSFFALLLCYLVISFPLLNIFYDYSVFRVIFGNLFDLLLLRIFFKDGWLRLIFIKTIEMMMAALVESGMALIAAVFYHMTLLDLLQDLNLFILLIFVYIIPVDFIIFVFGAKLINKLPYKKINFRNMVRIGFFPVSQLIILSYLAALILFQRSLISGGYLVCFILCILLSLCADIFLYHTFKDIAQKTQLETQNRFLKEQKNLQMQHYQAYVTQQDQIRRLRHDIINHVQTIKLLIAQNEMAEADEYADKLSQRFKAITTVDYCENKVLDAVFHNKMEYAHAAGVSCHLQVAIPEQSPIDDLDLMAVFSNLIDNAIHSAADCPGEKYIDVTAKEEKGFLIIKSENSGDGHPLISQDTSKRNRHGLGRGIVQDIAAKYQGSYTLTQNGSVYSANVILKNPSN